MAQSIYCGNNLNHPKLLDGTSRQGTKAECLQIGFGKGYNMPLDKDYGGAYAPIDNRRVYCGNAAALPAGYAYNGNAAMCLQKGVGLGKLARYREGRDWYKIVIHTLIILVIISTVFITLYETKPSIVLTNDIIDWNKFIPWFITFSLVLLIIRYILFYLFWI